MAPRRAQCIDSIMALSAARGARNGSESRRLAAFQFDHVPGAIILVIAFDITRRFVFMIDVERFTLVGPLVSTIEGSADSPARRCPRS
jgi:hypothetical protein